MSSYQYDEVTIIILHSFAGKIAKQEKERYYEP